jgi:hypothetical protein
LNVAVATAASCAFVTDPAALPTATHVGVTAVSIQSELSSSWRASLPRSAATKPVAANRATASA